MRVLFVGDVVGPEACDRLVAALPALRQASRADTVVVNAENCAATGIGMTVTQVTALLAAGADAVTGGNHAFDGPEALAVLALDRVARPANLRDAAGRGHVAVDAGGERLGVVVLADRAAMELVPSMIGAFEPPLAVFEALDLPGTVLVDFHAQSVMEKQAFAYAVRGRVAAVLGTHTHEATLRLHLLESGTALVTDVGMTGPAGGPQGFHHERFVQRARGMPAEALGPPRPADGQLVLGARLHDHRAGRAVGVERVADWPG
jgi:calcineurin-like phosphoesterase